MAFRKYICPSCKKKTGVNIQYGYPSQELLEAVAKDEVALGGCILWAHNPDRKCTSCGYKWKIKKRNEST
jgi:DNA-directed RNA polymerase subunit RPC12/RpoP